MARQYKSDHLAVVHAAAVDLLKAGQISEQRMRGYDKLCLVAVEKKPPKGNRPQRLRKTRAS